jgi:hypothetical protein
MMRFHKANVLLATNSVAERTATMTRYANANDMVRYLTEDVPPLEVAPAPTVATAAAAYATAVEDNQTTMAAAAAAAASAAAAAARAAAAADRWRQVETASVQTLYDPARAAGMAAAMPLLLNRNAHIMLNAANEGARPIAIQLGATGDVLNYVCRSASMEAMTYRRRHTLDCVGCRNTFPRDQVVLRHELGLDGTPRRVRVRRCITCAPDLTRRKLTAW